MASLDKMVGNQPPVSPEQVDAPEGEQASELEEMDLQIAVALGKRLMKDAGGLQAVGQAIEGSGDPVQAVAKFLVQLITQIKEAVGSEGVELSPRIVLANNGWVTQMLDNLEQELGLPPEFSDEVFSDVVETFKALAASPQPGTTAPSGQPAAGSSAGPAVPTGGM